jgi:hypothetical protein
MEFQSLVLLLDTVTVTSLWQELYRIAIEDINNAELNLLIAFIPRPLIDFDPYLELHAARADNCVISIVRFLVWHRCSPKLRAFYWNIFKQIVAEALGRIHPFPSTLPYGVLRWSRELDVRVR